LIARSERDETLPQVKAKPEVRISKHMLVADTRASIAWRVRIERVPVLHGRYFKELEECQTDGNAEDDYNAEELLLGSIHEAIDVEEPDHIYQCDVLGAEFDRTPGAQENEHEELEAVSVGEVGVVDMARKRRREQ